MLELEEWGVCLFVN